MLHPALARALATAHVEDLHRAAAAARPQADGMTPTEISHASLLGMRIRRRRPLIAGVKPREGQAGVRRT